MDTASASLEDSEDCSEDRSNSKKTRSFADKWVQCVEAIHRPIKRVLFFITHYAAVYPVTCIIMTILFSITILATGYYTNFVVESDQNLLWKPIGSLAEKHGLWVSEGWGGSMDRFIDLNATAQQILAETMVPSVVPTKEKEEEEEEIGVFIVGVLIHNQGDNVVSLEGVARLFEAHDLVRETHNYPEFCARYGDMSPCPAEEYNGVCALAGIPYGADAPRTCSVYGATGYFLHDSNFFHATTHTNEQVQEAMARDVFPGELSRFQTKNVIGYPQFDQTNSSVVFGKSLSVIYLIPVPEGGMALAEELVDRLLTRQAQWASDPENTFRLYPFSTSSFAGEFQRGIVKDIPLVPLAFIIMSLFTCLVFYRHNSVHSRSILGFGAVACVLLSIMAGYGLLFCCGVKFTSLTQVSKL
jgi:Niemann-Pick C1 protein